MIGVAVLLHYEDTPLRGDPVFVRSANSATPITYLHPVLASSLALLKGLGLASHRLWVIARLASLGVSARFASLGG
jgi:hypothetical protein